MQAEHHSYRGSLWLEEYGDVGRAYIEYGSAAALFPSQRNREIFAVASASQAGIHPDIAMEALEWALEADPVSPNLLYHATLQELRRGQLDAAAARLQKLRVLLPGWKEGDRLLKFWWRVHDEKGPPDS